VAIVLELIAVRVLHALDDWIQWRYVIQELQSAQTTLQTIITLTLSFTVFTFGSLLVAIQVASGQLTPRIIATALLRDNVVRYSVGLFVFTMVFATGTLGRLEKDLNRIPFFVAVILGFSCLAAFLYLIDYASRLLRPVSIVGRVGQMGLAVIEAVYPYPTKGPTAPPAADRGLGPAERTILHPGPGGFILAVNLNGLGTEARNTGCVIEFVPRVGDFIGAGEPLFVLYRGSADVDDLTILAAVAFGSERTLEQDPTFAFRILVDIALKALSPAINDPTTAVLAIDQLHRLLRHVGQRHLHDDVIRDQAGRLRLIFRTPDWDDFIHLSFTEIRHCGAGHIQVARRLRAMLENLIQVLPEHRLPALRTQLDLLDRTIKARYAIPEDLALARIPDDQGLGGSTRTN
jgi:uncharacterized membrane protein